MVTVGAVAASSPNQQISEAKDTLDHTANIHQVASQNKEQLHHS